MAAASNPAAWRRDDLSDASAWTHRLTSAEEEECLAAAATLRDRDESELSANALIPELSTRLLDVRRQLRDGCGVALVRGVPVGALDVEEARRLFRLIGTCLGTPVSQNAAGELMTDVTDTGADPLDPRVRLYATAAEQDFHTDGADLIGLLCLRGAHEGGLSRLVSSLAVFEEVERQRPDLAPLLFEDWPVYLHDDAGGRPVVVPLPIVRRDGERLSSFFIPWYITRAAEIPGAAGLSTERRELLELYVATANRPDLYIEMEFAPGDMQWIKNATVLHKRTAYVDWPESKRRRHLLRLWLAATDFADGDEVLRGGIPAGLTAGAAEEMRQASASAFSSGPRSISVSGRDLPAS